jgi:hypothetical protein
MSRHYAHGGDLPNNDDRADWAAEALAAFPAADNDPETNIMDLVCDLLHLYVRECGEEANPARLLERALWHYGEDLAEEGDTEGED